MIRELVLASMLTMAQPNMANNNHYSIQPETRTQYMETATYHNPANTQTWAYGIKSNNSYFIETNQLKVNGYQKKFSPLEDSSTYESFENNVTDAGYDPADYNFYSPYDCYIQNDIAGWLYDGHDSTDGLKSTRTDNYDGFTEYSVRIYDALEITNYGTSWVTSIQNLYRYYFQYTSDTIDNNYLQVRTIYTSNPAFWNTTGQDPNRNENPRAFWRFNYGLNYNIWLTGQYGNDYTYIEQKIYPDAEYIGGEYVLTYNSDTRIGNLISPYKNITNNIQLQPKGKTYVYIEITLNANDTRQPNPKSVIITNLINQNENQYTTYNNSEYDILRRYQNPVIETDWLAPSTDYEVVNIPGIMFTVLSMPFTFISTAFNLTLFPGTPYAINFTNLFLAIIAVLVFVMIIKIVTKNR